MWGYLSQKISVWYAFSIVILFALICIIIVRSFYAVVIRDIERTEKAVTEMDLR